MHAFANGYSERLGLAKLDAVAFIEYFCQPTPHGITIKHWDTYDISDAQSGGERDCIRHSEPGADRVWLWLCIAEPVAESALRS